MGFGRYILVGHEPVPVDDLFDWAEWFETADRIVAQTTLDTFVMVSTVFLGLDHNWGFEDERPILFETMVFGGPMDGEQMRYCTWDEADKGHTAMVERVFHAEGRMRSNRPNTRRIEIE